MTVMAREPRANAAFLRLPRSGNHHDLGLFGVGAQPPRPRGWPGALPPRVAGRHDRGARGGPAHPGRASAPSPGSPATAPPRASTAADPDGNEFEVMWMLPKAHWGEYENAAPIERLDLAGEVARWGGVRTAAELVPVERS